MLKPYIDRMFKASNENVLTALYNQAITMRKDSNNYVVVLIKLMENNYFGWFAWIISFGSKSF